MLGGEQYHLEAGFFQGLYPLFGIQVGGVEQCRIFRTVAPFSVCKRVDTEVQEGRQFHLLPGQLLRCGNQAGGHGYFLLQGFIAGKRQVLHEIGSVLLCVHSYRKRKHGTCREKLR